MIHIRGDKFELEYSYNSIDRVVTETARKLCDSLESNNDDVVFLVMMNGATWFADKIFGKFRYLPLNIEYVSVSSYVGEKQDEISFNMKPKKEYLKGKHIIIVEDIIDSGNTIKAVRSWLEKQKTTSISICPLCIRERIEKDEYIYSHIINEPLVIKDDAWLVGCGMDHYHCGRNLYEIYSKI